MSIRREMDVMGSLEAAHSLDNERTKVRKQDDHVNSMNLLEAVKSPPIVPRHAIAHVIVIKGRNDDHWSIARALLEAADDRFHQLPFRGVCIAKLWKGFP